MRCPGQETQYWDNSAIYEVACPNCNHSVEFFKDDTSRLCHGCGEKFINPKLDFGCASYCQYASQCLSSLPEGGLEQYQQDLFKDKIAVAVKQHLKNDFTTIRRVVQCAGYCEQLAKAEGANLPVILCAAYCHLLEPPLIKTIMTEQGAAQELVVEVIDLINNIGVGDSLEAWILSDSSFLCEVSEQLKGGMTGDSLCGDLERCKTMSGKAIFSAMLK